MCYWLLCMQPTDIRIGRKIQAIRQLKVSLEVLRCSNLQARRDRTLREHRRNRRDHQLQSGPIEQRLDREWYGFEARWKLEYQPTRSAHPDRDLSRRLQRIDRGIRGWRRLVKRRTCNRCRLEIGTLENSLWLEMNDEVRGVGGLVRSQ